MAHIHTRHKEHDHTASAFIMRVEQGEPKLLLHMHKKLGKLIQPAGHTELKENTWQGILREIVEETGYELSQLKVLQPALRMKELKDAVLHPESFVTNTHEFPAKVAHYHTDSAFAFLTDGEPLGIPSEGESEDLRWLTQKELEALNPSETIENVRQIGLYALTVIYPGWNPVDLSSFKS